mmetsp:Transcript_15354/g.55273  ORF Transcript_15354/g.55273 Transcript_15354/m.55273 type:complete len:305 (+) Transcript_15354:1190-2104(+)
MTCRSGPVGTNPSFSKISFVRSHTSPSLKSTYRSTVNSVSSSTLPQYSLKLPKPSSEHTANTLDMRPSAPSRFAAAAALTSFSRRPRVSTVYVAPLIASASSNGLDLLESPASGFARFAMTPSPFVTPNAASAERHTFNTSVVADAPAGTKLRDPPVERHSWKKRCVFGFSRTSASSDSVTGRKFALHLDRRFNRDSIPPPAMKCAQFFASGTTHFHTAVSAAAPKLIGTALSVFAIASTAALRMLIPSALRRYRALTACSWHSTERSPAAPSFTGSSLTDGRSGAVSAPPYNVPAPPAVSSAP